MRERPKPLGNIGNPIELRKAIYMLAEKDVPVIVSDILTTQSGNEIKLTSMVSKAMRSYINYRAGVDKQPYEKATQAEYDDLRNALKLKEEKIVTINNIEEAVERAITLLQSKRPPASERQL